MLAFAFGVFCLYLIPVTLLKAVLAILLLGAAAAWKAAWLRRPLACVTLGLLVGLLHIGWDLGHRPPRVATQATLTIEGTVTGLVERDSLRQRFVVEPERITPYPADRVLPRRVRLSWYRSERRVRAGERWRWRATLERPRGFANPVRFGYEDWLASQRLDATGTVRDSGGVRLGRPPSIGAFRAAVSERFTEVLAPGPGRAILTALVVGDRRQLTDAQWDRLRATGTTHLVAISGLHVGIVGGLAGTVVWLAVCWMPPLVARRAAPLLGAAAGLLAATGYAALAGFAVSTVRALLMLALVTLAWRYRRRPTARGVWLLTIAGFALLWPREALGMGLWLSLGAVAVIGWALSGVPRRRSVWRRVAAVQLAVTLGLAPLTLLLTGQVAWASLPANLVSVPLFSVALVPAALIASVADWLVPSVGTPLLELVGWALDNWYQGLGVFVIAGAARDAPIAGAAAWAALVGAVWLLLATGRWRVLLAAALPMPLLGLLNASTPPAPALRMTTLEVGQGTAVVLRSAGTTWVYDTGPSWGRTSAARFTLVPFLRQRGVQQVDRLVLSHADRDHAGGAPALTEALAIDARLAGEPQELAGAEPCLRGDNWQLGVADVRALWPPAGARHGNQASCVLLIRVAGRRILLAGDAEGLAEARVANALTAPVDALLVPHHGSGGASSKCFVGAARPLLAIVSAGHDNAYGMPAPEVVRRYRRLGAVVAHTGEVGAVTLTVTRNGAMWSRQERPASRKLHHERALPRFRLPARIDYSTSRRRAVRKQGRKPACGN